MCHPQILTAHRPVALLVELLGQPFSLSLSVAFSAQLLAEGMQALRGRPGPSGPWVGSLALVLFLTGTRQLQITPWLWAPALAIVLSSLSAHLAQRRGRDLTPAGWLLAPALALSGLNAYAVFVPVWSQTPLTTSLFTLLHLALGCILVGLASLMLSVAPSRRDSRILLRLFGGAALLFGGAVDCKRAVLSAWLKHSHVESLFEQAVWNHQAGEVLTFLLLGWTLFGVGLRDRLPALGTPIVRFTLALTALGTVGTFCLALVDTPTLLSAPKRSPHVGLQAQPEDFPAFAPKAAVIEARYRSTREDP